MAADVTSLESALRSAQGAVRRALRGGRPPRKSKSPADYDLWLAREPSVRAAYPEDWVGRDDLSLRSGAIVAAIVHVYYPELLDELIHHLGSIPVPFDLLVTNASGEELVMDTDRMPRVSGCVILDVENRGRDLWPLAQLVNAGLLDGYELVIKVHTKRSDWRQSHRELAGNGGSWRDDLLSALLGDTSNVATILSAYESWLDLGIVTADGSALGPGFWGQNEPVTASLLRRLDLELEPRALRFAAGSMYWVRASVLRGLADLRLSRADFEDERGQIDGTTPHALERVIGVLATGAGLHVLERSELPRAAAPST
jgi:lipopolysaccharide biosynthesis protein